MDYLVSAFYFSLFFIGLMIGLVLILKNRNSLAYTYFGCYNLITSLGFLVSFLLSSGLILQFPHFFRTAAPFHYLWGPLCYLFIRNLLSSNNKFYKTDILHFIPFAIHFVELIPFYLSSADTKVAVLKGMFADGNRFGIYEGWLTSYWHSLLKFSHMLIYNLLQWRLFISFNKTQNSQFKESNQTLINWVKFLNVSGLIMIFVVQYHRIFLSKGASSFLSIADIIFYVYYLCIWYYLIYKPDLLNGIKLSVVVPEVQTNAPGIKNLRSKTNNEHEELLKKLETYMQLNQPFLDEDFGIKALSNAIYVPEYKISRALKYKYDLNFPEYVNRYRIAYIEEKLMHDRDWKAYTIEGMAFSAGFNSRNAFYNAFRKIKGVSPANYFKLKP